MRSGVLIFDEQQRRMDIRFGLEDYYGGLHCGMQMEVLIGRRWVTTRIELGKTWYLVGVQTTDIRGLRVRI